MNWKVFFITLVFILVVDFLWLGVIAASFYTSRMTEVGRFQDGKLKVVYWSALLVYLLMTAGICLFVLPRVEHSDSLLLSFGYGAAFGFIAYGIYDFTNHATLKDWPLSLMAMDMAWGSFLCGLGSVVARYAWDHLRHSSQL